jgi:hypothetical protein
MTDRNANARSNATALQMQKHVQRQRLLRMQVQRLL